MAKTVPSAQGSTAGPEGQRTDAEQEQLPGNPNLAGKGDTLPVNRIEVSAFRDQAGWTLGRGAYDPEPIYPRGKGAVDRHADNNDYCGYPTADNKDNNYTPQ